MDNDAVFLVLDLDDTLYSEREYSRSALSVAGREMARRFGIPDPRDALIRAFEAGEPDAIGAYLLRNRFPAVAKDDLLAVMRAHLPSIQLRHDAALLINSLRRSGRGYAILTDGRGVTQRQKICALGCQDAAFISISEECGWSKGDEERWVALEKAVGAKRFCYVGDNPAKDFLIPNLRGWDTVMLKSCGHNIHVQDYPSDVRYHPRRVVNSLEEML